MKKLIWIAAVCIAAVLLILSRNIQVLSSDHFEKYPESAGDYRANSIDTVEITELYALGLLPSPFGCPDTLGIRVKKNIPGAFNVFVKVRVVNIDTPYVLKDSVFYTISNSGTFDTLIYHPLTCFTLFAPGIELASNRLIVEALPGKSLSDFYSIKEYCQFNTCEAYNYADPCLPDAGGTGFDGRSGNLVARFNNYSNQPFPVYAVDYSFFNSNGQGNQPYRVVIYTDNGSGKPGSLVYSSPVLSSPVGNGSPISVTHKLANVVNISGNSRFYVGIRQLGTTNIKFSYQNESPVRPKIFFFSSPDTGTAWRDFSDSSKNQRLDISPRTSDNLMVKAYLQGFYNGTNTVADTAKILIRKFTAPYAIIDSAKAVLDTGGTGIFRLLNIKSDNNYFFVLKHRNHIETWSRSSGDQINDCSSFYNFTDNINKAYGNNMIPAFGKFAMYGGDINQDGCIDGNDISPIDNDGFNFATGYLVTDINGDNIVDLTDLLIADNNAYNFVCKIVPA